MNTAVRKRPRPSVPPPVGRRAVRIEGGRVLRGDGFSDDPIMISQDGAVTVGIGRSDTAAGRLDATGLLVLPGIVDVHGDAFERQIMPRPGVHFPIDIALLESDRQAVANGITTIFHGVTWSWEPGLRGPENARMLLNGIEALRSQFQADTRFHLRHETYNLDAEIEILDWIRTRRIDVLAFNDHMLLTVESGTPHKLSQMIERSGLSREDFFSLVERIKSRSPEVPKSIARLAKAARRHGVPLLSHDDNTPEKRQWFRSLGCRTAEFPTTLETAEKAIAAGDHVVLGAPNVVRGGSHMGWIDASEMVARRLCSVLASDYYYPALLLAPFLLAWRGIAPLEHGWKLVSENPADAMGLSDRGRIEAGRRADIILVDASDLQRPRLVASVVGGRIVHLTEAGRMLPA